MNVNVIKSISNQCVICLRRSLLAMANLSPSLTVRPPLRPEVQHLSDSASGCPQVTHKPPNNMRLYNQPHPSRPEPQLNSTQPKIQTLRPTKPTNPIPKPPETISLPPHPNTHKCRQSSDADCYRSDHSHSLSG